MMAKRGLVFSRVWTAGLCLLVGLSAWAGLCGAEESVTIAKSEEYFPDTLGSRWTYRGQINEGPLQTIELKFLRMYPRSPELRLSMGWR